MTTHGTGAVKKAGIKCKEVTKTRDISSDCGLAISVGASDEAGAASLMASSG